MAANRKILWVDDDPDITEAGQVMLQDEGFDVSTASSAEEGKQKASEDKPDLIIMDVIMGGEHGFNAVEDLKSDLALADIPVIVFSGVTHRWKETTATRQDGLMTEADDFVDKENGFEALLEVIRAKLG